MPAPSELTEGYPYPRTQPLLLDHDVSSPVVQASEIVVSFAAVFLLMARLHPHPHRHPPEE